MNKADKYIEDMLRQEDIPAEELSNIEKRAFASFNKNKPLLEIPSYLFFGFACLFFVINLFSDPGTISTSQKEIGLTITQIDELIIEDFQESEIFNQMDADILFLESV